MKKIIKEQLIKLPRKVRIYYGRIFLYMLGKVGTHEFYNDITLYNELKLWIDTNGKPNKK